ncbi:hypothetical protein HNP25_001250 [Arcicella rosea]|uniref:Uncharacterized protein n=2 Tax=Arcicella rosea TaxID=502909 RepID=A0A841EPE8_9BACT|nr:hypothetical protein [Arcicella rosea]
MANYKKINNIVVPTSFEVLWRLKTGNFSYAKFDMQKIEYDKPIIFQQVWCMIDKHDMRGKLNVY